MVCPKCGAERSEREGFRFCGKCGSYLDADEATSIGLDPGMGGLLCYLLGWLTGLIFILVERKNDFVRFHAMQSIVVFGTLSVFAVIFSILGLIPYIGIIFDILNWILLVVSVILWLFLMIKASQGERYRLPWAGDHAQVWMPGRSAHRGTTAS